VADTSTGGLPKDLRAEVRRRQREHARRWVTVLAILHPHASIADLEIAAFAAIGLLLGAARWPRAVRAHPALTDRVLKAARNSMGCYAVTAEKRRA